MSSTSEQVRPLASPLSDATDLDRLLDRVADARFVLREPEVVLVGFATHSGTVVAAERWGDPARVMTVPAARPRSVEALLHDNIETPSALFVLSEQLPDWLAEEREHRAIGVVYRPQAERWGNYVPSVMGRRYDALCWFDQTTALSPLHGTRPRGRERETWSSGR